MIVVAILSTCAGSAEGADGATLKSGLAVGYAF